MESGQSEPDPILNDRAALAALIDAGARSIAFDAGTVVALKAWKRAQIAEQLVMGLGRATRPASSLRSLTGLPCTHGR